MRVEDDPQESRVRVPQEKPAAAGWKSGLLPAALLALAVALAVLVYLGMSSSLVGPGYPLDDAWIHQTYARSLGERGEWSFNPGEASGGSTAPLWSALLALGYALRLPPMPWTLLLGGLSLFALARAGEGLLRSLAPRIPTAVPIAGLFLIGEWHMTWAAVSGMETVLFAALILLALWRIAEAHGQGWLAVGALIGLSVWVRPDGLTLLGPALLALAVSAPGGRLRALGWLVAGLLLFFAPYLLFNLAVQGTPWPNTLYAKQAEYAALREAPLLARWLAELRLPLIGAGIFLLPGFAVFTVRAARQRQWPALGAVIWFLGYGLVYALLLPVTYQYGRYFMPAMPVFWVAGLAGTGALFSRLRASQAGWLLARVGALSAVICWLAFFVIGAGRYAQDVAIIETEMVRSARWVAEHTEAGAVIAAHDIGALGYFGQRRLLDLAGLVTPEVTPFLRDETRLAAWLDAREADYLVVFSDWYRALPQGKERVFETDGTYSGASGGKNTVIYRWQP